jgi:hypothetical protein
LDWIGLDWIEKSIQATEPYRADEDDFGYFEIYIINSGTKGYKF